MFGRNLFFMGMCKLLFFIPIGNFSISNTPFYKCSKICPAYICLQFSDYGLTLPITHRFTRLHYAPKLE